MLGKVLICPPDGFLEADTFWGYEQPSTGSAIIIQDFPCSLDEIAGGFTADNCQSRAMKLLERDDLSGVNEPRVVLHLVQTVGDSPIEKWVALLGNDRKSVMIVANIRVGSSDILRRRVRNAIYSAEWIPGEFEPSEFQGAQQVVGRLRLARHTANSVVWTLDGRLPMTRHRDPIFILSPVFAQDIKTEEVMEFAALQMASIAGTKNHQLERVETLVIDELYAVEMICRAIDVESGKKLVVYQTMLCDRRPIYVMVGVVLDSQCSEFLPAFQTLARSFRRENRPTGPRPGPADNARSAASQSNWTD